jgi:hypothetical protein
VLPSSNKLKMLNNFFIFLYSLLFI